MTLNKVLTACKLEGRILTQGVLVWDPNSYLVQCCRCCYSVAKSYPTLCNTMTIQYTRLLCPPISSRVCSNSCPLSQQCYLTTSSSADPFSFCFQSFPASGPFQWVGSLHQVVKYWSFSFHNSPSNEYSGLISFRTDWLHLLAVQGTLKSSPASQFESISFSGLSFLYGPTLTSVHDYWKNHSFEYMDLCWQNDVSAF